MARHGEQRMRNSQLQVFNDLHVVRWYDDAVITHAGQLATLVSSQADGHRASLTRRLKGLQHIWRASAGADAKGNVAPLNKVAQLCREHLLVRSIVGPSGHQRHVVCQRQYAETFRQAVRGHGSFGQIASEMRSQRGAASVSE